jgi:1-acyl-sn-glycerol-3-phosphate acyltransferase
VAAAEVDAPEAAGRPEAAPTATAGRTDVGPEPGPTTPAGRHDEAPTSAGFRPERRHPTSTTGRASRSQGRRESAPPLTGPHLADTGTEVPPALDLGAILTELGELGRRLLDAMADLPVERIKEFAADPLRGVLGVAAGLGVDWQSSVDEVSAYVRSRLSGDYVVDEFGFDPEFTTRVFLPAMRPLVRHWFRVEVRGVENLPLSGSALLVSNHAGTLPLDGLVLNTVVFDEIGRHVRLLGADLVFATPFSHDFARRIGATLACQEDAERLLSSDQLVAVFPEGFKGLGKPYADRYKLQRFGRGGFVSAAVRTQVPIVPVSIVGSEEIYPLIASAPALARAMGVPYFPITPLFPWLGVLGLIPLPSKWIISFGEAIATDELPPGAAEDPMVVFNVTDQVRETIQHALYALLMQRRSAFF